VIWMECSHGRPCRRWSREYGQNRWSKLVQIAWSKLVKTASWSKRMGGRDQSRRRRRLLRAAAARSRLLRGAHAEPLSHHGTAANRFADAAAAGAAQAKASRPRGQQARRRRTNATAKPSAPGPPGLTGAPAPHARLRRRRRCGLDDPRCQPVLWPLSAARRI
jgi:hypothetical protein